MKSFAKASVAVRIYTQQHKLRDSIDKRVCEMFAKLNALNESRKYCSQYI